MISEAISYRSSNASKSVSLLGKSNVQTTIAITLIICLGIVVPGRALAQQGPELFSLSRDNATLYKIDPESGATIDSRLITLSGRFVRGGRGLAASPVTQQLFAVLAFQDGTGTSRLLATIDPVSGTATEITASQLGQTAALAFDNSGTLYGGQAAFAGEGFANKLYVFDTITGQRTEFMPFANSEAGLALALNPLDGHIYHLSGSLVFGTDLTTPVFEKINTATKTRIEVPLSGDDMGHVRAMSFGPDGNFLVVGTFDPFGPALTTGRFFRLTPGGVATQLGSMNHKSKGIAFVPPVTAPNGFNSVVGVADLNNNGSPEVAVHVEGGSAHVHIRDGMTDALLSDINFGDDPVSAMAVIDDISGNGLPEIALLGTRPDGNVRVQVKDSDTGLTINNIFYGSAYSGVDMTVLPDTDGNGADELLVVGANASGGVRAQARDALTDAATSTTYYGDKLPPLDVLVMPDVSTNSEPEVLVHGRVTASGQGRAIMKDSATNTHLANFYFGTTFVPIELVPIQDVSGDGIADLAQLGKRDDTDAVRIQMKRSDTGATIANAYTGTEKTPVALVGIGDANGNGAPDVALLARVPAGTARVVVRDGATGAFIRNIFASAVSNPAAIALIDDLDASGNPELAILGDDGAGTRRVQIKDSISGAQVNTIDFP